MTPTRRIAQLIQDLMSVNVIESHDQIKFRFEFPKEHTWEARISIIFTCPDPEEDARARARTIINSFMQEFSADFKISVTKDDWNGVAFKLASKV